MANNMPKVGGRMVLEGEKEYREALTNINAGLRVNYSEMQLVTAQYAANADSVEALRAKSDALTAAMTSQSEKVDLLKARLQKSAEQTGEGSAATMRLKTEYNNAQTALQKMQNQLDGYDSAIKDATKSTDKGTESVIGFGESALKSRDGTLKISDVVHKVTSALGVDLPPAADKAIDALGSVSTKAALLTGGAIALVAALVKVESKMIDVTKAAAENASEIAKQAKEYSLTAEQIQELHQAEQAIEVDQDTITSSMAKLTAKIKDNSDAFDTLGVKTKDSNGQYRDSLDIYYDTIDALGNVKNQTEADTLAQELFGKSYADVKPIIDAGSSAIKQYGEESKAAGYIMSNDTVSALDAVYQKNLDVEDGWEAISSTLAKQYSPAMTDVDNSLINDVQPTLKDLGESTVPLLTDAMQLGLSILKTMEPKLLLFALDVEAVALIIETLIAEINSLYQGINMLIGQQDSFDWSYWDAAATTKDALGRTAVRFGSSLVGNATGTNYWTGGTTLVGEDGPEIVDLPRGSRIYPNGQSPQSSSSVTNYYQVTIPVNRIQELNDIVEIAQNEATSIRQGVTK